jgi:DNA gyrase/topoisomerase IV subunit B
MHHPTPISVLFEEAADIEKITPILHMRLRPHMYLGAVDARGIVQLLDDVLALLLTSAHGKPCEFEIEMRPRGRFLLQFRCDCDWLAELRKIDPFHHFAYTYILQVLRALSSQLRVQYCGREYLFSPFGELQPWMQIDNTGAGFLRLEFTLDHSIFACLEVNWESFLERIHILAMLHPQARFLVANQLHILPSVQHFHAPDGLIELYRQTKNHAAAQALCDLHFRGVAGGYAMDISIGLAPVSSTGRRIRTFANTQETVEGGSLEDGIVAGLAKALNLKLRSQKSKLRKCVIACAVVLGNDFEFLHPTKRCLHAPVVKRAAGEIACRLLREQFVRDAGLMDRLLRLVEPSVS